MSTESQLILFRNLLRELNWPTEVEGNFVLLAQVLDKILGGTAGYEAGNALKLGGVLANLYCLKTGNGGGAISLGPIASSANSATVPASATAAISLSGGSANTKYAGTWFDGAIAYNSFFGRVPTALAGVEDALGYVTIAGTTPTLRMMFSAGGIAIPAAYANTTASAANMFVDTDGALKRSTSSADMKDIKEDMDPAIALKLVQLFHAVWYRSLCPGDRSDWSWYGGIAEEVAEIDPRFVHWGYKDEDYVVIEVSDGEVEEQIFDAEEQPSIEIVNGTPVLGKKNVQVPRITMAPVVDVNGQQVLDDKGNPILYPVSVTQLVAKSHFEKRLKDDAVLRPIGLQYERFTVPLLVVAKMHKATIADLQRRVETLEES